MKQTNRFVFDMLDQDAPAAAGDRIYRAGMPRSCKARPDGSVAVEVPFVHQVLRNMFLYPEQDEAPAVRNVVFRAYGDAIVRMTASGSNVLPDDAATPMLCMEPSLKQTPLSVTDLSDGSSEGWSIRDEKGRQRAFISTRQEQRKIWSDLQPEPPLLLEASVSPDGTKAVPFAGYDTFFPHQNESFSLGYVERNNMTDRWLYSLKAFHDENYAGTGERFAGMNLKGKTFVLENTDGLGNNSRRAYKNVPFYLSSRGYGVLIMTSAHVRLSLADISTRAAQALVEDDVLDLFFIGGSSIEEIVRGYRRLTGFPSDVPLWSYGTWMAKMTYFSADETRTVVRKMREGHFPLDVIHLDTGWFATDWKCEWTFSSERFPDPDAYLADMRSRGVRVCLWQLPSIAKGTKYYDSAKQNRYFAPPKEKLEALGSNFSDVEFDGNIDFTNPAAVTWYQGLLEGLLRRGVSAIKTDFGEVIDPNADYMGLPYKKLHNMYSLLYQKAAFEVSRRVKGKDALIWARAGWIGCQRYPVHWSGDCASSWDGMAGALRGGLHAGLSGFGFWSHDVPGFHGLPSFMNSKPADDVYVRWTQFGVFTSHLRYHGSYSREPYEYPAVADTVREWLKLRYALIPYIARQGTKATQTGYPVLRALIFHHADDPMCWNIDDEYYFGDAFLVAPVMNSEGVRDIYLPAGSWIDFWTGEALESEGRWLMDVRSPLERLPLFVRKDSRIPVYPEAVECTDGMDLSKVQELAFDDSYRGFAASVLGTFIHL